jgi:hypothetical protein
VWSCLASFQWLRYHSHRRRADSLSPPLADVEDEDETVNHVPPKKKPQSVPSGAAASATGSGASGASASGGSGSSSSSSGGGSGGSGSGSSGGSGSGSGASGSGASGSGGGGSGNSSGGSGSGSGTSGFINSSSSAVHPAGGPTSHTGALIFVGVAAVAGAAIAASVIPKHRVATPEHPLKGSLNRRINLFSHLAHHPNHPVARPPRRHDDDVYVNADEALV